MALDQFREAESAIGEFYRKSDAISSLESLYNKTLTSLEKSHSPVKSIELAHTALEMAVQKVGEKLSWRLLKEPGATPASVGVPELLDLSIDGIVRKYLPQSAAYKLLEDLMETQTISACESLWDLLEQRKEKLSAREFMPENGRPTKASLCLLRLCNSLLRRVSKTHNSVFCGRILVFLSFTFALSERSAVNAMGKGNTANTTVFEDEDEFDAADVSEAAEKATPVKIEKGKSVSDEPVPIDYNLYRTFWDLQRFCRDHQLATKSADDWEKFFDELNTVLSAFEGNAFSPDDLERTRDLLTSGPTEPGTSDGVQDHFFQPKYLTNSRLFRLQLRDPILRECMLTQFLILFSHLSKVKQPDGTKTPKTKLHELNERVTKLLRETPSDGKGFSEMLSVVLERDRNWVLWKQDKCPAYEKFPPPPKEQTSAEGAPKKRRLGDMPGLSARPPLPKRGRQQEGGESLMEQILTESAKPAAILEKISDQGRATAVPMKTYTDRFAEAWDPENGIEEEYWPDKDKMFCWRTLRMAMKTNVSHMHLAVSGTGAVVKGILGIKEEATVSTSTTGTEDSGAKATEERDVKEESIEPIKTEAA